MALADSAGGASAFLNLPEGATGTSTIESKTNFLGAVREGASIAATATPLHRGATTIVVETELRTHGRQTRRQDHPNPSCPAPRRDPTSARNARPWRHDGPMLLGEDLLQWLLLALGAALFAGNLMAVVRPPERQREQGNLERAPVGRSLLYAGLGLIAAVWALASLIAG